MLRRTARRDRLTGLFIAGVVFFDPPVLNLVGGSIGGWPVPYLYLFGIWALLIAAAAYVSESGRTRADGRTGSPPDK
ncbi:MAG TPA: hypothetical protein VHZ56_09485 [Devosia sp.]|nr:hypothetical protein [Devosia sp.]